MKVKLIFKQDSLEKKQFVNLKSDDPHITQVFFVTITLLLYK